MGAALAIRRDLVSAEDLRRLARREQNRRTATRMLAIAHALEGASRAEAARLVRLERQALRDAVVRFNAEGLAGLRDRPRSGRKPRLTPEQGAELAAVVDQGPDPERDGVVRWRRIDLRALIKARYDVELHERSGSASCCAGSASPASRRARGTR